MMYLVFFFVLSQKVLYSISVDVDLLVYTYLLEKKITRKHSRTVLDLIN